MTGIREHLLLTVILLWTIAASAQPATEIYLFEMKKDGFSYALSDPVNISGNKGYDNQPYFLPDGSGILFASERGGQTDVALYKISDDTTEWLTHTEASEYSPTVMPDGDHFSTVVLEKDGTQKLWKFPMGYGEPEVIVEDIIIGYHTWYDANTLFSFVLGDPPTLQQSNISLQKNSVVARNPGRSLHRIPASNRVSFVDKSDSTQLMIKSFNPETGKISTLAPGVSDSEDMAWTPEGTMLMGSGSRLFANVPSKQTGWYEIADLSKYDLERITRLAVSPEGNKIAVVVQE